MDLDHHRGKFYRPYRPPSDACSGTERPLLAISESSAHKQKPMPVWRSTWRSQPSHMAVALVIHLRRDRSSSLLRSSCGTEGPVAWLRYLELRFTSEMLCGAPRALQGCSAHVTSLRTGRWMCQSILMSELVEPLQERSCGCRGRTWASWKVPKVGHLILWSRLE